MLSQLSYSPRNQSTINPADKFQYSRIPFLPLKFLQTVRSLSTGIIANSSGEEFLLYILKDALIPFAVKI
jgi:hypothetical protein